MQLPCPHWQYEQAHEDEAAHAKELERRREAAYVVKHGSLDGWRPTRGFPCSGTLEIVEDNGSMAIVCCASCGFETTTRSPGRPPTGEPETVSSYGGDW